MSIRKTVRGRRYLHALFISLPRLNCAQPARLISRVSSHDALFLADLSRIVHNDLRLSFVELDLSSCTYTPTLQRHFRLPEFGPVTSEDHDCKGLIWVRLIDVKKCWLRMRCRCVFSGGNHSTD